LANNRELSVIDDEEGKRWEWLPTQPRTPQSLYVGKFLTMDSGSS